MGKDNRTKDNDDRHFGDDPVDEERKVPPINKVKKSKVKPAVKEGFATLVWKYNRSFELHVDRKMYRFEPMQERSDIPVSVVEHIDFQNVKGKFIVRGN